MYNVVGTLAPSFLIGSYLFLQVTRTTIKAWMTLNICQIPSPTTELAALERLKNQCTLYNVVSTVVCSFLDGSASFLQASKTTIEAWMTLNICQIPSPKTRLAALECLKKKDIVVSTLAPSFLLN